MGSATLPFTFTNVAVCVFKRGKHWNSWSPGISFPWDHKKGLHSCCSRGSRRCNLLTLSTLSCTIKSRKPVLSITLNVWLKLIQLQWVGLNNNSPLNFCHSMQFRKSVLCSLFLLLFENVSMCTWVLLKFMKRQFLISQWCNLMCSPFFFLHMVFILLHKNDFLCMYMQKGHCKLTTVKNMSKVAFSLCIFFQSFSYKAMWYESWLIFLMYLND